MTKPNPKPEKIEKIKKLAEMISSAKSVVFVDYTGLNVKTQEALKKELKKVGGKMFVAKNTLFKIAGEKAKLPKKSLDDSILSGQTAVIVSEDDPVAPIQTLGKFAKENNLPNFKAGVIEDLFQNKSSLELISRLPSKEELTKSALGTISSPLYSFIAVLQANMQKLVFVLEEAKKKGGES